MAQIASEPLIGFARAFLRAQPHQAAIVTTLVKDKIERLGHR